MCRWRWRRAPTSWPSRPLGRFRHGLGGRFLGWAELGGGGALAATRLTQPSLPALGAKSLVPIVHGALALGHAAGPFLEARAALQGDARSEALRGIAEDLHAERGVAP